jgi:hypothetical protein
MQQRDGSDTICSKKHVDRRLILTGEHGAHGGHKDMGNQQLIDTPYLSAMAYIIAKTYAKTY